MFNRELKVDMVKKSKQDGGPDQSGITFEEKSEIISRLLDKTVVKVGLAVCAYVVLDTFRKVAVASVTK